MPDKEFTEPIDDKLMVIQPDTPYLLWTGDILKFHDKTNVDQLYYNIFLKMQDSTSEFPSRMGRI